MNQILVGIDGSEHSDHALDWAVDQAVLEHRPLTLVHAAPSSVALHGQVGEAEQRALRRAPGLEVGHVVRYADATTLLTELSGSAALVVVGSHGRGPVGSRLLGSVGLALAKHAGSPVVVHRPWHPGHVRRGVVVGVDGTERSAAVLAAAYRMASLRGLPLRVLHCRAEVPTAMVAAAGYLPPPSDPVVEAAALAELVAGRSEDHPDVHVVTETAAGDPVPALVAASADSDLLVVGRHHGGALATLLAGSVTAEVVERASGPVLVVPVD